MHPFPPRSLGRWREVCLALAMPALVAAGQEAVPPPTPVDVLRSAVDQGTTPGAALLVVQGGETLQEVYLGRYHPDLVLPFDGASAWLSTVTVLSLADAGLLELEDPLVKFFPDTPDEKAAITLRQVLSHTAGLSSSHPCQADRETTLESCAQAVLESPLAGTPGREFLFGGAGLQLAGRIAEIVSGETWAAVFERRIADPLGLGHTSYGTSPNPNLASGARGTLRDYGRFLASLLPPRAGARPLLSPVQAVAMLTDQSAGTTRTRWPLDSAQGYGLGAWLVGDDENHAWATAPGALGFTPWLLRQQDFLAVIAVSSTPEAAAELRQSLPPSAWLVARPPS